MRRPGRTTPGAASSSGDRLWGRGACDMKGGIACGIVALRALHGARACGSPATSSSSRSWTRRPAAGNARGARARPRRRRRHRARADGARDRHGRGRPGVGASRRARPHGPLGHPLSLGACRRPRRGRERDREGGQAARGRRRARAPLGRAQGAPADAARDHDDQPGRDRGRLGRRHRRHAERHGRVLELRRLLRARPLAQVPARRARRRRQGRVRAVRRPRRRGRSLAARASARDRVGRGRRLVPAQRGALGPSARDGARRRLPRGRRRAATGRLRGRVRPRLAGRGRHTGRALRPRGLRPGPLLGRVRRGRRAASRSPRSWRSRSASGAVWHEDVGLLLRGRSRRRGRRGGARQHPGPRRARRRDDGGGLPRVARPVPARPRAAPALPARR